MWTHRDSAFALLDCRWLAAEGENENKFIQITILTQGKACDFVIDKAWQQFKFNYSSDGAAILAASVSEVQLFKPMWVKSAPFSVSKWDPVGAHSHPTQEADVSVGIRHPVTVWNL